MLQSLPHEFLPLVRLNSLKVFYMGQWGGFKECLDILPDIVVFACLEVTGLLLADLGTEDCGFLS